MGLLYDSPPIRKKLGKTPGFFAIRRADGWMDGRQAASNPAIPPHAFRVWAETTSLHVHGRSGGGGGETRPPSGSVRCQPDHSPGGTAAAWTESVQNPAVFVRVFAGSAVQ
ncbi:hypothetical protein [Brevibacillus thermoruber]|uniref:hypothetical protein n=1 Tax=Brevibacillus thermoruber TaxID=33942 RepID=UPI0012686046|nr:hypothetical protein [Brevibacillus thermoruber]